MGSIAVCHIWHAVMGWSGASGALSMNHCVLWGDYEPN